MAYKAVKTHKFHLLSYALLAGILCSSTLAHAQTQAKFYRYINDQGTKVIASSIPPKYVGFGYEILAANGRVIEVIEPEPEPEDKERVEQERALQAEFEMLARRYSNTREILLARDRRLSRLDASIAILRSNISNLNNQIEENMSKAASYERAGKKIPTYVFSTIDELRAEVKTTEQTLRLRLADHQKIMTKFANDVTLFEKGKALETRSQTAQAPQEQ